MQLSTQTVSGHLLVSVSGELDVSTTPDLRERLFELLDGGTRTLVIDLTRVDFLDSTTLGMLVGIFKRVTAADGALALVCPHERLLKIFRMTGLDRVFTLRSSVAEAMATLGEATPDRV